VSLTPVTLRNGNDTYVVAGLPSNNYSGVTSILTKAAGTGSEARGLLWFGLPFPPGAQIIQATLRLYQVGAEAGSHTIKLQRITALSWIQSKVNWNNQPASTATGEVSVTLGAGAANREWAFDVTAHMQIAADGGGWSGWKIVSTTDEYLSFWSTQAGQFKPVLEVSWADNPDAPSTLAPAGNRAVSVAKPVLRFDYTDVSGSTSLNAVQVQINATNVWTSPTFDSGTVVTSVPELDLNTTAYAGLSAGSSTFWRVRVQDAAGLWSDWSAGAQFQRQTKGTLAFTNPPVSGEIGEPTPPIIWSLTGRVQKAWQSFITPASDNSTVLYDTGKVSNTDTSYTLPLGILKDDSSYNVHLRVWDTIDREGTPTDQAYTYTVRTFFYDYDATVNPVTSLVATDQSPEPKVRLTWSRSTAPDSFAIRRNGVIVARVEPAEVTTGGTGYAYTDRGVPPRTPITWRVDAIVNGQTSSASPSVVGSLQTEGVWLSDYPRDLSVMLSSAGEDNIGNWDMGETAVTYTPAESTRPIRVTQALRGHEGTISGRIKARAWATIAEQKDDLWLLKATPGREYLLTLSDMTIPVVIGKLVIKPVDDPNGEQQVSFDFWQTGNLQFRPIL
jgi:hypothetical protein